MLELQNEFPTISFWLLANFIKKQLIQFVVGNNFLIEDSDSNIIEKRLAQKKLSLFSFELIGSVQDENKNKIASFFASDCMKNLI